MRPKVHLCAITLTALGSVLCIYNCANNLGTNVLNVHVHADGAALVALKQALSTSFSMDFNTLAAASKFFGGIFDMINEELEPYGVQVRGNFNKILLDNYEPRYDHMQCNENDPISSRASLATSAIKQSEGLNLGNRLFLFFCTELVNKPPSLSIINQGNCGNIIGLMFSEIRALKDAIYDGVIRMISRSLYKESGQVRKSFNSSLCNYVKSCIGNDAFGEFKFNLKKVRHLATEQYVVRTIKGPKKRPKGKVWSHISYKNHDIDVYPVVDYSNSDELFSDFEE